MPLVNVVVNGRAYTLACDEGEEARVRELGEYLDRQVTNLRGSSGQGGDTRLLLMAGLMVADELNAALMRIEERDNEIARLKELLSEKRDDPLDIEDRMAELLEGTALRIEAIAAKAARA